MAGKSRKSRLHTSFDEDSEQAKRAALYRRNKGASNAWEVTTWRDYPGKTGVLPCRAWLISLIQVTSTATYCTHDFVLLHNDVFTILPDIERVAHVEYQRKNREGSAVVLAHGH